jgi:NO-binding membrane sensor protein with MHYT domain
MLNEIIRYFDLYSEERTTRATSQAGERKGLPFTAWLFIQYIALFLGILAKQFIDSLAGRTNTPAFSFPILIVSLIIATAIFPAVYKKALKTADPSFVECCVTFAAGLGYKTLIDIRVG